ncbi:MAG: hypothetical protein CVU48_06045 [Candidatus Cloacimonetes bacterium HGW-Cloacimonetes-1]|jgi:poly-gamma-glutamate capsule biosynthesis protein CapA/YwtB (metallophosphatase superfamily)|nr:MAG: hypothetical protein CVU48_06045 [Candidatus Cloacimonetes bacterium HGW-Cloacimonetes-1]
MLKASFTILLLCYFCASSFAAVRLTPLETFDSGSITLSSWADEDLSPDSWVLDSATGDGSAYCLRLYGNTWKRQQIYPYAIDSIGVIQVKVKTVSSANVQGIGFSDGMHQIFYSFAGTRVLDIETWVTVYQGAMYNNVWNTFQLPLAADWQSFWGYLPTINSIIYVNDLDNLTDRNVYFDAVEDISGDLPVGPQVSINIDYPIGKNTAFQFISTVYDPDSSVFTYTWNFGDSTTSTLANPYHVYTDAASHPYTVTLMVTDDSGKVGFASMDVLIDLGENSLPVTMNFVGDIMLARRYETGIIPTLGVNAIFRPTKPIFGDAAEINVANLEVVLSNMGSPHPTKSVVYRGSPNNVSGLVYAGIDVVSTANNHTLDYGLAAMQQMESLLDNAGIKHSGSGVNSYQAYLPTLYNKKGLNIAFLRSSDRTGQYNNAQPFLQAGFDKPGFAYMTPFYIQQQIDAVQEIADLKIVEMHGGSEYSLTPGSGYDKGNPFAEDTQDEDYNYRNDVPHQWDIDIRHSAIDNGADMVIVHHPHIIQGLELYQNKLIAHSLGNFVFDLDYPETMPSMVLYADAYLDGFTNYRVKPVFIDGYIPRPASGQLGTHILDYLAMRSRDLNTRLWVNNETMEAKVLMNEDNPPVTVSTFSTIEHFNVHSAGVNLTRPIKLPRRGSISEVCTVGPQGDVLLRLGQETIWYGNFEDEGTSFWAPPAYETTLMLDGNRSARINTASSGIAVTSTIPKRSKWYDNTKKFTLHGWIKTENVASANFMIQFYVNRTTGGVIATENVTTNISGNSDWTYYFKEISIPGNAYYYDIKLTATGYGTAGYAIFDNIGLIEWTEWTSAAELSTISWPNNFYWMQAKSGEGMKSVSITCLERGYSDQIPTNHSTVTKQRPTMQISPNPFNPSTKISCSLPVSGESTITIYNIKGQKVKQLAKGFLEAGVHRVSWDSKDESNRSVASGIYFIKIDVNGSSVVRKAILMK